jgi:hypothetical protein
MIHLCNIIHYFTALIFSLKKGISGCSTRKRIGTAATDEQIIAIATGKDVGRPIANELITPGTTGHIFKTGNLIA